MSAESVVDKPGVTWDGVRHALQRLAAESKEWAGAPMPIDGLRLTVEPKYPFQGLNNARLDDDGGEVGDAIGDSEALRNQWRSHRGEFYMIEDRTTGKAKLYHVPAARWTGDKIGFLMHTLGVGSSPAWSLEAEANAMEKLASLIKPHLFLAYATTGAFLETSPRSRLTYVFRRCRPTLVLQQHPVGQMRALAALCLHPIGFYQQSWAGVMTPTDCVVAHVLLMRGDEHGYWRQANQHRVWMPEAGL